MILAEILIDTIAFSAQCKLVENILFGKSSHFKKLAGSDSKDPFDPKL